MADTIVKIKLSNIKQAITNLAQQPDFFLKDLHKNSKLHQDHRLISYVVSYLYHKEQYKLIISAIEAHDKPSILIPGTLGAYLFGCLLPTYGEGSRNCSPLCIGSVPYPPTAGDTCKDCEQQVWVLRRYQNWANYIKVNNSKSSRAIIYVDTKFQGFLTYDIDNFSHHGLKRAMIMDTTEDGHHVIVNESPITELPMQNGQTPIINDNCNDSNQTAVAVLIIVISIIVIIFIIWALLYY